MDEPLWKPSPARIEAACLTGFARRIEAEHGVPAGDLAALHAFSVERPEAFFSAVWTFAGVVGDGPGPVLAVGPRPMPGTRWFPEALAHFAGRAELAG